jgi:hypothetical protein
MPKRAPEEIRARILEWERRRRENGSRKQLAATLGVSIALIDSVIRDASRKCPGPHPWRQRVVP